MGPLATDVALLAAAVGGVAACIGRDRRVAVGASLVAASSLLVSCLALIWGLVDLDPSLRYVEQHTSAATPVVYRIAALWGGMEGSLLFWAFVVAGVGAVGALVRREPSETRSLAMTGAVGTIVFAGISRLWASPFDRTATPSGRGDGLLAVLQHPAMVYHPPVLYAGLALVLVPAALTARAVARRRLDTPWAISIRRPLLIAWTVLGAGILAGSQWAYAELGWGGLWAWDPVENASLLPWLAVTGALHAGRSATSGRLVRTTAAFVLGAGLLVVSGVYLTRSGTTGSIHAFADAPTVSRPLAAVTLLAMLVTAGLAVRLGLGELRAPRRHPSSVDAAAAALITISVCVVAVGTYWPAIESALDSGGGAPRAIVRASYYEQLLGPIVIVLLVAMGAWTMTSRTEAGRRSALAAAVAAAVASVVVVWALRSTAHDAPIGIMLVPAAAGIAIGPAIRALLARRRIGASLAHLGVAVFLVGAIVSSFGADARVTLSVGESTTVDGFTVELVELDTGQTGRFEFVRATVTVDEGTRRSVARPELRAYDDQPIPTAEAAIDGRPTGDLIVVVESVAPDLGGATLAVRSRPLLPWTWVGGVLAIVGGVFAIRPVPGATGAGRRATSRAEPDAAATSTAGAVPPATRAADEGS